MIKFKTNEDNKQFISIRVTDGADTREVLSCICSRYPSVKKGIYKIDNEEILLNLDDNVHYDFSLNALRSTVDEIAKAKVYHFCVDMNEPLQRYNSNLSF